MMTSKLIFCRGILFCTQLIVIRFFRLHEFSDNPNMKFLVKININNIEVSKGYGRNKKSAKYAAA